VYEFRLIHLPADSGGAGPLATPTDYREDLSKACADAGVRDALGGDIDYIVDVTYNVCPSLSPSAKNREVVLSIWEVRVRASS
jgi:hypothetical protein